MIKIEAGTLEEAYKNAATSLECSVTELKIELVQSPSNGFLGLFKKSAIIVAVKDKKVISSSEEKLFSKKEPEPKVKQQKSKAKQQEPEIKQQKPKAKQEELKKEKVKEEKSSQHILNDTIMPTSFVSTQDDEDEEYDVSNYLADYDDEEDAQDTKNISEIALVVKKEINNLFDTTCFKIDSIEVSVYDENTILIEFKGDDAALLIGKEGYRYKALSYMIFNWINTKYQVQLRLEIAEFLKNQEESISKYLVGVCENIDRDGRAQTKILDGVLVQIALKELRDKYPNKYIVIRSTRDGLKYIIINDYHTN
ncbi:MAG: Jag N-terminal domain-containing protein [Sulfurimonas sp.]|nr:Jag N-terminal domain-containing protein [Sulfurimonas sp.]